MKYRKLRYQNKSKPVSYLLFAFLIIYAGGFFVWEAVQQKLSAQKINALKEKAAKVESENQRLKMRISDITSMNSLEETGKRRFGLVSPDVSGIVIIEDDLKK